MEQQLFIRHCVNGDLDGINELIKTHNINIHADNEYGFRQACQNGHLHIVEYLINIYFINIHAKVEGGFRWACQNGQGKERLRLSFTY